MTRVAYVFDRSRETAIARALLIARALDAAQAGGWTVEPVTSRNRLLADIARQPRQPRSLALVDLADNERNIIWRLGDRIIATLSTHPDLRARCTPIALTAYSEHAVAAAVRRVGAAGLMDATQLLIGIDAHAATIGRLLTGLADAPPATGAGFVRWPSTDPAPASTDTRSRVAAEFERWFSKTYAPWHLDALAGLAVGKHPSKVAFDLVARGQHRNTKSATQRVSELNAALARCGPGPTNAETAARFLTRIAYLGLPGPTTVRYPDLHTAEAWYVAGGRVRAAAWLLPEDQTIFDAVRHHHRRIQVPPRAGNRSADAHDRQIIDACRAAADALSLDLRDVLAATERTLQALHDAHIDYCEWPQIELAHAIRQLERAPTLLAWRQRLADRLADRPIALHDDPSIVLDRAGHVSVDGNRAEAWERRVGSSPCDARILAVDALREQPTSALKSAETRLSCDTRKPFRCDARSQR